MDVTTKAMKLLACVQAIHKETFQDLDLEFRVAVDDFEIVAQHAQPVLKANLRVAPDAVAENL